MNKDLTKQKINDFKNVLKNGLYSIRKVEKTPVGYEYKVHAFNDVHEDNFNVSFDFIPYAKGIVYIEYLGEMLVCHNLKVNKCNFNGIPAYLRKEYVREYIKRYIDSITA